MTGVLKGKENVRERTTTESSVLPGATEATAASGAGSEAVMGAAIAVRLFLSGETRKRAQGSWWRQYEKTCSAPRCRGPLPVMYHSN